MIPSTPRKASKYALLALSSAVVLLQPKSEAGGATNTNPASDHGTLNRSDSHG
jgi:hypothetical protein